MSLSKKIEGFGRGLSEELRVARGTTEETTIPIIKYLDGDRGFMKQYIRWYDDCLEGPGSQVKTLRRQVCGS